MVSEARPPLSLSVPAGAPTAALPNHTPALRRRRFFNWFPLGLTYATFYMGRYNFNVAKGAIGATYHLSKAEIGVVATCGFWVYALSVLVNGPIADRIGGRKAILLGAAGAAAVNLVIGSLFMGGGPGGGLLYSLSLLYSINMYFQSYGALSVVKINASWFHVRERGVLGGVFGSMISLGYWFALGIGGFILVHAPLWAVYAIPSAVIATMFGVDYFLVHNRPSDAGHLDFDTGDASETPETRDANVAGTSDVPEPEPRFFDVVKKVLTHPVLQRLAIAEFCTGFVRQGLLFYFPEFLTEVHHVGPKSDRVVDLGFTTIHVFQIAAAGITIGGIVGALVCGFLSDRLFQSRRAPVAFIFYLGQIVSLLILGTVHYDVAAALMIPVSAMWIFGVHGMLSGTASMDFGGKKAAATAAGLLDGVQYLGAGLTGVGLGWVLDHFHWGVWTYCLVPFSLAGALLMLPLWNAKPGASSH